MNKYFTTVIVSLLLFSYSYGQKYGNEWPIYRGKPDLTGKSDHDLPVKPQLLWSLKTGVRTKSSPVISNGKVYFGNNDGTLYAVGMDSRILWKYEAGSAIEAPPVAIDNKIVFGDLEGKLRALDNVTGKVLWTYETESQIVGSANFWQTGSKSGIVFGSYDYCLHCVDPETGKMMWKVETNNYVNGTPAVYSGKIVFGGCDGLIRIVDPLTGKENKPVEIGVYIAASPALTNNKAFFGDYEGTMYCVDIKTLNKVWQVKGSDENSSIIATPSVEKNMIVVGNADKNLYCYNMTDGVLRWKFRTNGRIDGSAAVTPGKVLFAGRDGTVWIIGLARGERLWSFYAGSPVSSSPAVGSDGFYILTEDGRLLKFGAKN